MKIIESPNNEIIKKISLLKDKKQRDKENLFIVEGIKQICEIKNDWEVKQIFVCKDIKEKADVNKALSGFNVETFDISKKASDKLSSTKSPQGLFAVVEKKSFDIKTVLEKSGRFIFLENISDPGNLGTIIRSAEAFGISGVFVSKGSADIYSDKTLRSTMGSIFNIPVMDNIKVCDFLKISSVLKIKTYAADLKAKKYLQKINLSRNSIIFIGNESKGLSEEILNNVNEKFKIEMPGKIQSLNASIAASIIMYEIEKLSPRF
ncbi:MAG: RNA methyltransferase [Endomicrobium sp.]|jgi:TrmH family RNA methyltransferase|nr:RNA methyltransferase [Endomicrobium sp.]